jgi:hypothetical protein
MRTEDIEPDTEAANAAKLLSLHHPGRAAPIRDPTALQNYSIVSVVGGLWVRRFKWVEPWSHSRPCAGCGCVSLVDGWRAPGFC